MTDTDHRPNLRPNLVLAALSGLVVVLTGADLLLDLRAGTTGSHAVIEGMVILIGSAGAIRFVRRAHAISREARDLREHAAELAGHLEASRAEAAGWRRDAGELIAGLGAAIDEQLVRWELTPAEKEVAWLLLKGLSHKEIAEVRSVNETTVRQQARTLYRKAGLSGRNDLAAFFLEDLLGPQQPRAT